MSVARVQGAVLGAHMARQLLPSPQKGSSSRYTLPSIRSLIKFADNITEAATQQQQRASGDRKQGHKHHNLGIAKNLPLSPPDSEFDRSYQSISADSSHPSGSSGSGDYSQPPTNLHPPSPINQAEHHKSDSSGERPLKCQHGCGRAFNRKCSRTKHHRDSHGVAPPSYPAARHICSTCQKAYTRPSGLRTHMYSHTGEKPFKCEHVGCGREFNLESNYRRHKKTHS